MHYLHAVHHKPYALNLTKEENYTRSDCVAITLEWTAAKVSSFYGTYYVSVIPLIPIPPVPFKFNRSTRLSVTIDMLYNTTYNVSLLLVGDSPCGRRNVTLFNELYYYCKWSCALTLY